MKLLGMYDLRMKLRPREILVATFGGIYFSDYRHSSE